MAFVLLKSLKAHRRIAPLNINASLVPDPFPHTKNEKALANAEAKIWSVKRDSTRLGFQPPARVSPQTRTPYPKNEKAPANAEAKNMVGEEGFEPPTLWSQTRCATKLRYSPSTGSCNASQRGRMLLIIRL